MSDPYRGLIAKESPATAPHHGEEDLEDLRRLLLAPEQDTLAKLQGRLDQLRIDAQSIRQVLPDAIRHSSEQDQKKLERSLEPIFVETFKRAVRASPQLIADAIYPILGRAIRKAIITALQDMVQSLNETLEHSFSLQWRIEAWRTGKPFGEVVLLHTLKFRVEEVFLIHKDTSTLLHHVMHPAVRPSPGGHEDHVASMFTAVKTAVQKLLSDSFRATKDDTWKSFETHGGLVVWVEPGPTAVLAGVIRGIPPGRVRSEFQDVLDTIHIEFNEALHNFRGDTSAFEATREHLEKCLKSERAEPSAGSATALPKTSPVLWLGTGVMLILMLWGIFAYLDHRRWGDFLEQAEKEPGLVVISVTGEHGKSIVRGFRDPLSSEPDILARKAGLSLDSVVFELESFLALSPEMIEKRAISLLHPPNSVAVSAHQDSGKTILVATGSASHEWITRFRQVAQIIPGVNEIRETDLRDNGLAVFEEIKKEIEARQIQFEQGSSALSSEARQEIRVLSTAIERVDSLAQKLGKNIRLEIHGHTSKEGSSETNAHLRLARAQAVFAALHMQDLKMTRILPPERGFDHVLSLEEKDENLSMNRRVSFHVVAQNEGVTEAGR